MIDVDDGDGLVLLTVAFVALVVDPGPFFGVGRVHGAQPVHGVVGGPTDDRRRVAEDLGVERLLGDGIARVLGQLPQQRDLGLAEPHPLLAAPQLVQGEVDNAVAEVDPMLLGVLRSPGASTRNGRSTFPAN